MAFAAVNTHFFGMHIMIVIITGIEASMLGIVTVTAANAGAYHRSMAVIAINSVHI